MNKSNNKLNNQQGFTLIEALIALFVLTIGILALSTMQVAAIQGNATANKLTVATSEARGFLELLINVPFDDVLFGITINATPPTALLLTIQTIDCID